MSVIRRKTENRHTDGRACIRQKSGIRDDLNLEIRIVNTCIIGGAHIETGICSFWLSAKKKKKTRVILNKPAGRFALLKFEVGVYSKRAFCMSVYVCGITIRNHEMGSTDVVSIEAYFLQMKP